MRERLGMSMRDVENASRRLASARGNRALAIPPSRLSDIETNTSIPSIFRLYSLSVVYRLDVSEILQWYGLVSRHDGASRDVEPEPDHVAASDK
jgi:transcriptional regulator with XRE-family HTH domain